MKKVDKIIEFLGYDFELYLELFSTYLKEEASLEGRLKSIRKALDEQNCKINLLLDHLGLEIVKHPSKKTLEPKKEKDG